MIIIYLYNILIYACITHEMCCNRSYPLDYVLLRDYPWDYVLLQGLSVGICVVAGIIHGIVCYCRDYLWDCVLLQGWRISQRMRTGDWRSYCCLLTNVGRWSHGRTPDCQSSRRWFVHLPSFQNLGSLISLTMPEIVRYIKSCWSVPSGQKELKDHTTGKCVHCRGLTG